MAGRKSDFTLPKFDDIFSTQEMRDDEKLAKIRDIPLELIDDFPDHPYKVRDDEDMMQLAESIKERGVITPATVRQKEDGRYELISGHRRKRASELAGFETLRCEVVELDRDDATILMVESNLQRSVILPSEKAFAYKMRLDAMKRKAGRPSKENVSPVATNSPQGRSDVELAEQVGESKDQIRRYIRLTELIDPLLEMVDTKAMAMNAGVELSYLKPKEQVAVVEAIKSEDTCPSIEQAKKIRRFNDEGRLNPDVILSIMQEQKADKIKITLGDDKLKKYFPKGYSKQQMEDTIIKLLEKWHRKLEMER